MDRNPILVNRKDRHDREGQGLVFVRFVPLVANPNQEMASWPARDGRGGRVTQYVTRRLQLSSSGPGLLSRSLRVP